MNRLMAYRFRLRTPPHVAQLFRRFAGCRRFVFNRALALQIERHQSGQKRLTYPELCRELTAWRHAPETAFLAEAPIHPLQQVLKDLDRAFVNFFERRADFPRFKKKGRSVDSFRYPAPQQFAVDAGNGRVKLPKVGWVRYRNSRRVEGSPRQVTVRRDGRHWLVSILVGQAVPDPVHPKPDSTIGIDLGVVRLATLSTGEAIPPLNALGDIRYRLRRLQRQLARKTKFSNNWRKQKERIAKLHHRAADRRADFLHKFSDRLSKNHALICIEDLGVKGMSASAKGTAEKPGRMVKQKAGLNRSILDQGWSELARQLEYKAAWRGGRVVKVPAAYTSQTCSRCGHACPGNRPTQATFRCGKCRFRANADHNAALNVLAAGRAATACGGFGPESGVLSPRLHRPAEAGTRRGHSGVRRNPPA